MASAAWALSGNPIRALAVLVVATPCPLILAAPVAIVAGISRAASRGVIVKGGGALETLARARTLVFDKTGTLTTGTPRVASVETFGATDADTVLRLAASLDQVSAHVFANAIVAAARRRSLELEFPTEVQEHAGTGIEGTVGGRRFALGQANWLSSGQPLPEAAIRLSRRIELAGLSSVFVALDGQVVGALVMDDPIRADTPRALAALRRAGISRIVVLSGDGTMSPSRWARLWAPMRYFRSGHPRRRCWQSYMWPCLASGWSSRRLGCCHLWPAPSFRRRSTLPWSSMR